MRRLAILLCALLPLLPAQGGRIHTSRKDARVLPLPKGDDVWHFVVFGDRTGGPAAGIAVLAQAVVDTNLLDPDLVMTVGDLIEGYNATPAWMTQMKEFRGTMGRLRMPWYPVAGNHDIYWRGPDRPAGAHEASYEQHFGPLWYWFRHKNAAMIVLYTDEGDSNDHSKGFKLPRHTQMSAAQLSWLEGALAANRELDHVFVFLHHPRWVTRNYPGSNWNEVHTRLVAAGNVSAVFAGHIHQMRYDGVRDGIEYVTLATVGGHLPRELPQAGWLHHLNTVTVRPGGISMATLPVGAAIDPRTITPRRIDDVNALLRAPGVTLREALAVDGEGGADGELVLVLANPSGRPIEATVALDGAGGWIVRPAHRHARIAAGETLELRLRARRPAGGFEGFDVPRIRLRQSLLYEDVRVELPERTKPIRVRLDGLAKRPDMKNGVLVLDGDDCLRVAPEQVAVPDGPITLEAWVNAATYAGRRPLITKTEGSEFGLFANDGKLQFSVHLNGRYVEPRTAPGTLEPGRWHHVAGVFDGTEIRVYLDGRKVASGPASGPRTRNQHPLYIGADPNRDGRPVDHLRGSFDEVRLSKVARYRGETFAPARRFEPDEHSLLLLHLDETIGPFHPDASPRQAHPTTNGNPRIE